MKVSQTLLKEKELPYGTLYLVKIETRKFLGLKKEVIYRVILAEPSEGLAVLKWNFPSQEFAKEFFDFIKDDTFDKSTITMIAKILQ